MRVRVHEIIDLNYLAAATWSIYRVRKTKLIEPSDFTLECVEVFKTYWTIMCMRQTSNAQDSSIVYGFVYSGSVCGEWKRSLVYHNTTQCNGWAKMLKYSNVCKSLNTCTTCFNLFSTWIWISKFGFCNVQNSSGWLQTFNW